LRRFEISLRAPPVKAGRQINTAKASQNPVREMLIGFFIEKSLP
jgi:hypothetical protein